MKEYLIKVAHSFSRRRLLRRNKKVLAACYNLVSTNNGLLKRNFSEEEKSGMTALAEYYHMRHVVEVRELRTATKHLRIVLADWI